MNNTLNQEKDIYKVSRGFQIAFAALEYFISILVGTTYLAKLGTAVGLDDGTIGLVTSFLALGCSFQLVSIFLGDELTSILDSLEKREEYDNTDAGEFEIGVAVLPHFPRDISDRNRTSPFAFTGNKFEFRMVGSSLSIAGPNTVLNTIVAEELFKFADKLEQAEDFNLVLNRIIRHTIRDHKRIIFNGDGYSKEWEEEAKRRGLYNLKTTVDALPSLISEKSVDLFTKHCIYTEKEIHSRYEILLDIYVSTVDIEAKTMINMAKRDLYPAALKFAREIAETINAQKSVGIPISCRSQEKLLAKLSTKIDEMYDKIDVLESVVKDRCSNGVDVLNKAQYVRDVVLSAMNELRFVVDSIEEICSADIWPVPSYGKLMYNF